MASEPGAAEIPPLAGFTVAVTASRRRDEFGALLEQWGARVVYAPALRLVPIADDVELRRATKQCLAAPLDLVIATTGFGFRGWLEAAEGWGMGDELIAHLRDATIIARGPKARGAVRACGLTDSAALSAESTEDILSLLRGRSLSGQRVAVQMYGEPAPELVRELRAAGAEVIEVAVYRWAMPEDVASITRLVEAIISRSVDAVAFTSAPAVTHVLQVAEDAGQLEPLLTALRRDVLVVCVGPVAAAPFDRLGVPTSRPSRARLGALAREIVTTLPAQCRPVRASSHLLEVRGHAVVLDGVLRALPPGPMSVLRLLARQPGRVVSRADLLAMLPGDSSDEHAVETTVGRLRTMLGDPRIVRTVVKRGYRLACEPAAVRSAGLISPSPTRSRTSTASLA
ncbi:MAG: uroporphyrinogen-III synthase [Frankiaceae bacterium]|jgi:uroporphyrinogen-III synthase|nr:uroporphyrinogen-III synthase [Frankiaceae bacterium]